MKTIKEALEFCDEFTFYDLYSYRIVIELKYVRDFVIYNLSNCDHIDEVLQIGVLGVSDDMAFLVIDRSMEDLIQEKNILRVGFLQLLYSEKNIHKKPNMRI